MQIFDWRNMPLQVQVGANDHINYNYDESGSRIGRFYGNANEYYLRDAGGFTRLRQSDERELAIFDMGTQRPKQINLFAADQTRLTDVVGQVGTADVYPGTGSIILTKQYFLKDHLGSTRVVLNDAGACFSARDYYPYGENMREFTIGTTNRRYQFNGKERDIVTDLDYSIARYYNAKLGVWLSVDPLLDKYPGLSPYNYCLNNPVNYLDPDGMVVVIKDSTIQSRHDARYNEKNADGTYKNKTYREQYDQLNASDIVYNVINESLSGSQNGLFTTEDGVSVTIKLDIADGATILGTLSHEFVHGQQFEAGKISFSKQNGKWGTLGGSFEREAEAFLGQQEPNPLFKLGDKANNDWVLERILYYVPGTESYNPKPNNRRTVYRTKTGFMVVPGKKGRK